MVRLAVRSAARMPKGNSHSRFRCMEFMHSRPIKGSIVTQINVTGRFSVGPRNAAVTAVEIVSWDETGPPAGVIAAG